jgi:hypothetical protein
MIGVGGQGSGIRVLLSKHSVIHQAQIVDKTPNPEPRIPVPDPYLLLILPKKGII